MLSSITRHWAVVAIMAILCCCWTREASATHSMGLDLTYECLGNDQYKVTLTFYRDCNGINVSSSPVVNWRAACGSGSVRMARQSIVEITPSCPGIVGTACNGGNGTFGIEKHTFTGTMTLPSGCTDVTLSHSTCCRNAAITTLSSPTGDRIYIESELENSALCNNSPVFTNDPVTFGCVGQPFNYNHGATDVDGDQLTYSFVTCYDSDSTPVSYNRGFSSARPLTTSGRISIDPNTGAILFTPSVAQVGVLCVAVDEFRNGVRIGRVVRDIQFTALNCANNAPTLSGIDGSNSYDTTVVAGSQFCFDMISSDPDRGQSTTVTWNNGISGGSFTTVGSPFQTGTFCWTPTAADVGANTFTVTVSDDFCPIVGQNTYTFTVNVLAPPPPPCDSIDVQITGTTDLTCSNNDGMATIVATGGTAPYTYQVVNWATGIFYTNNTGIFDNLTAGSYSIWVQDANGCTPNCSGSTFTISGNVTPLAISATAQDLACPSNSRNAQTASNLTGSISVAATGGTAPYLYSIDNGNNFQSSSDFLNLGAGTYSVVVMDDNGCSQTTTATVGEPDPIVISIRSITPATCGLSNGSITVFATGGAGGFLYYINGQSQTSSTFNNLAAGTYTFRVCDVNYCVFDTTFTIPGTPGIVASATTTTPSCIGDCDGTATISTANASGAVSVVWDNGATTTTITNLCAGTYTAVVTDSIGCEDSVVAVVADPAPIDVTLISSSDETCAGNDGTATLNVTGGTAPYTFNLANFTNNTTATSTSGVFTTLNEGQQVVNVSDANGCTADCATQFTLDGCGPILSRTNGNNNNGPQVATGGTYLSVNPNPASNLVQVRYALDGASAQITIVDANGKPVSNQTQTGNSGSFEVEVSNWSGAAYFVVLRNEEGKVVKTTKLIIE